ncbi:MAG: branched-chain amino acid ABC transporter permease [Halobacterium sp.]
MALDPASVLVNAVMSSALYALIAIGFTLIFGVGGVLNLAHGAVLTIGAFTAYYVVSVAGLGIWAGALAAIAVPAAFSAALYLGMIRHVQDEPITVMILTLVTAIAVEEIVKLFAGTQAAVIPSLVTGTVPVAGGVQANRLLVFVASTLFVVALFGFVNYTRTGKAILATSMSATGASLVGIESERMYLYTWVLAGAFAGFAGLLLGSLQTATWNMGRSPLVLSFSIVVLGGIGSIRGSLVGAYVIGFLETLTTSYVDSSLSGLAGLVVLVLILLVKPEGLFGREFTE